MVLGLMPMMAASSAGASRPPSTAMAPRPSHSVMLLKATTPAISVPERPQAV